MIKYNLSPPNDPSFNYAAGLLPQRNLPQNWYQDSSCRSNLADFKLSSENKRIIKLTSEYTFKRLPLSQYQLSAATLNQITGWVDSLGWDFPKSSIKTIFTRHLFNQLYLWNEMGDSQIIAYAICYFGKDLSHICYVFYQPELGKTNLPIRLLLQCTIDSYKLNLKY